MSTPNGLLYQSSLLLGIPGLIHGYSTRGYGDARKKETVRRILRDLTGDAATELTGGNQIHGNTVSLVDATTASDTPDADGLVSRIKGTFLMVHVADCVPILLADPEAGVVAAVHAGWKGTLSHIAREVITQMIKVGATPRRIRSFIGPHIGGCCYTVSFERVAQFRSVFGNMPGIAYQDDTGWHLDIGRINRQELLQSGIRQEHIDAPITCTSCQINRYYSYRKDSAETFGEIIGVIGMPL